MNNIKFGTSGFRGIVADNFTKENIQKVAYAICKKIKQLKLEDTVVPVGFDNRFMGKEFAMWLIEVFAYQKIKTLFFENPTPSPLVAFETKNREFGIHITASHNPYFYNGIKIFLKGGRESPEEFNRFFESVANEIKEVKSQNFEKAQSLGLVQITNNIQNYCDAILSFVDIKLIRKSQLRVLFNAMHGSTVECVKYIFEKLGIKNYEIIKAQVDPYFEGKVTAPYVTNISDQIEKIKNSDFDFGFALDGDGDRFTALSSNGEAFDCNYLSAVFLSYLIQNKETGTVVKNCALSQLLEKVAEKNNCKVINAKVGFKNISVEMIKTSDSLMGVESNGIAFKKHILQKDGILMAVLILQILSLSNKNLSQIVQEIKTDYNYQCQVVEYAYPISAEKKAEINNLVFKQKMLPEMPSQILKTSYSDGLKMFFDNDYWAVIRFSGNENVVRLFVEMPDKKICEKYIKVLEKFIGVIEKQ